jgi:hypothetical protein
MTQHKVQGAVKDNIRQLISQFPTGFLLLNVETGELYAASERALTWLKLDGLPTQWGQWPVPLKEFQLSLEGPDVQRAEVTIPWPENPRTFGFNLSTVTLDNLGKVRVCLFSDITQIIQDRLALEQFKTAFVEIGSPEAQLTRLLLALPDLQNTLSTLAMLNHTCQHVLNLSDGASSSIQQVLAPHLTRMAQYLDAMSNRVGQLQGEPHPLNVRHVILEQALKSAWLLALDGQATLDSLPDSQTPVLADSVRLEQAIGLILRAQVLHATTEQKALHPSDWVPRLTVGLGNVSLLWKQLLVIDGPAIELASRLLGAMGMQLEPYYEGDKVKGLSLMAGRWCQDTLPEAD